MPDLPWKRIAIVLIVITILSGVGWWVYTSLNPSSEAPAGGQTAETTEGVEPTEEAAEETSEEESGEEDGWGFPTIFPSATPAENTEADGPIDWACPTFEELATVWVPQPGTWAISVNATENIPTGLYFEGPELSHVYLRLDAPQAEAFAQAGWVPQGSVAGDLTITVWAPPSQSVLSCLRLAG